MAGLAFRLSPGFLAFFHSTKLASSSRREPRASGLGQESFKKEALAKGLLLLPLLFLFVILAGSAEGYEDPLLSPRPHCMDRPGPVVLHVSTEPTSYAKNAM